MKFTAMTFHVFYEYLLPIMDEKKGNAQDKESMYEILWVLEGPLYLKKLNTFCLSFGSFSGPISCPKSGTGKRAII